MLAGTSRDCKLVAPWSKHLSNEVKVWEKRASLQHLGLRHVCSPICHIRLSTRRVRGRLVQQLTRILPMIEEVRCSKERREQKGRNIYNGCCQLGIELLTESIDTSGATNSALGTQQKEQLWQRSRAQLPQQPWQWVWPM